MEIFQSGLMLHEKVNIYAFSIQYTVTITTNVTTMISLYNTSKRYIFKIVFFVLLTVNSVEYYTVKYCQKM